MGSNLNLACWNCHERAFVLRGKEAEAIAQWGKWHYDHKCEAAIDNGVAEKPWLDEAGWREVYLPEDRS